MIQTAVVVLVSVAIICLGVPIVLWAAITVLKKALGRG